MGVQIQNALATSIGMLIFVSPQSLESDWVIREVTVAAKSAQRLIIPVFLTWPLPNLPPALAATQGIVLTDAADQQTIRQSAAQVVEALEGYLARTPRPKRAVSSAEAPTIAEDIAQDVRASIQTPSAAEKPDSVFVVHGHDLRALAVLGRISRCAEREADRARAPG
jgi:hypothetical protein